MLARARARRRGGGRRRSLRGRAAGRAHARRHRARARRRLPARAAGPRSRHRRHAGRRAGRRSRAAEGPAARAARRAGAGVAAGGRRRRRRRAPAAEARALRRRPWRCGARRVGSARRVGVQGDAPAAGARVVALAGIGQPAQFVEACGRRAGTWRRRLPVRRPSLVLRAADLAARRAPRSQATAPGACSRPTRTPCGSSRSAPLPCRVARVPLALDLPRWDGSPSAWRWPLPPSRRPERRAGMKAFRQRLELAAVRGVRAAGARCCRHRWRAALGTALGTAFYLARRAAPARRARQPVAVFPGPVRGRAAAASPGGCSSTSACLLLELLRFSALSPEAMRRAVEVDGEERVRAAYAKGRGVLFFTGHFGFWELHAIVHALLFAADRRAGPAARQPGPARRARATCASAPATRVIYREGAVRKVLRTLAAGHGVAMLIDQHMHSPDAIWVRLLPAAGGDDLDAGRAGAAHRRAGGAGVHRAAAGRPLPLDLRARRSSRRRPTTADAVREFTQRCTDVLEMYVRRQPELWLWMHRRWRDAPAPETRGMFPAVRDDGARRCLTRRRRVVVAGAQLAGRRRDGAAGAAGACAAYAPDAHLAVAARPSVARAVRDGARGGRGDPAAPRRAADRASGAGAPTPRAWPPSGSISAVLLPNSFMSAWIAAQGRHPRALGLRRRTCAAAADAARCAGRAGRPHQADYYLTLTARARACRPSPRVAPRRRAAMPRAAPRRRWLGAAGRPRRRGAGAGRRLRPRQAVAAGTLCRAGGARCGATRGMAVGARRRRRRRRGQRRDASRARRYARRRGRPGGAGRSGGQAPTWRRWPRCSRARDAVVANDSGAMHLAGARRRAGRGDLRRRPTSTQTAPLPPASTRRRRAWPSTTCGAGRVCCGSARSGTCACAVVDVAARRQLQPSTGRLGFTRPS